MSGSIRTRRPPTSVTSTGSARRLGFGAAGGAGASHLDRQKGDRVLGPRRLDRLPKQPAPGVELLRVEIVATRHRRETAALRLSLGQDPQLVLIAPDASTLPPQDLHSPHRPRSFRS
jgi:hypothetical protein